MLMSSHITRLSFRLSLRSHNLVSGGQLASRIEPPIEPVHRSRRLAQSSDL